MVDKEAQPIPLPHKGRPNQAIRTTITILTIATVACLGIASLISAIKLMSEGSEASATTERRETMFVTKQQSAANREIPPVDVWIPAQTQTATFALG